MTDHIAFGNVIGILKADPERKITKNGTAVTNFSVACEGEIEGRKWTGTYKAVLWGKNCDEFMAHDPRKGDLVEVEGRLANRKYEYEGQEKWVTEIIGSAKVLEAYDVKPEPAIGDGPDDAPF